MRDDYNIEEFHCEMDEDCAADCECQAIRRVGLQVGDLLVDEDGERFLVAHVHQKQTHRRRGCGCGGCYEDICEYGVYTFDNELSEVITKGGGTMKVLGISTTDLDTLLERQRVMRDGRVVYAPIDTNQTENETAQIAV